MLIFKSYYYLGFKYIYMYDLKKIVEKLDSN
jgi:hypothetical protein